MKLKRVNSKSYSDKLEFSAEVGTSDGPDFSLVFEVSPVVPGLGLDRADPFLLPCALLAMERGEDLEVGVPVSSKLLHNTRAYVIPIFHRVLSFLREITISAADTLTERYQDNSGVVAGFSGGIDSFALLQEYYFEAPAPEYKITHLVFNNAGSHFPTAQRDPREIYRWRLDRLRDFAQEIELPLYSVQSNVQDILPFKYWEMHSAINASIALLFQPMCSKFLYASGYSYEQTCVRAAKDPAIADPILLPSYSTESMECLSVGSQYNRVDKTRIVVDMPWAKKALDICLFPANERTNCGGCDKCLRTLLTLEILGRLEDFEALFDLGHYYRKRSGYIAKMEKSDPPFGTEIIELANSLGYKFAVGDHLRARISKIPLKTLLPDRIKMPVRKLFGAIATTSTSTGCPPKKSCSRSPTLASTSSARSSLTAIWLRLSWITSPSTSRRSPNGPASAV